MQLQNPIPTIINGEKTEITELVAPEVITVGTARKIRASQFQNKTMYIIEAAGVIAGLKPNEWALLHAPDALEFIGDVAHLMDVDEDHGIDLSQVKPVRALAAKLSADPQTHPVEWAAQILQFGAGMKREEVDALDLRTLNGVLEPLVSIFFTKRPN
jgi:hypothetical protein